MKPSVSVLIPAHNRRHTLDQALSSVTAQSHRAHEIIVIDDGSTDGTAEWLADTWPDITVISQDNQGVSAARNRGMEAATGEWLALLDSDDAWQPEKLSRQLDGLANAPDHRLCHTDELWYRNGVRVNPRNRHQKRGGHIFTHCLPLCAISPSAALIHCTVFTDIGGFDEALPACEDYDFWLRFCAREPVLYIDEPLVIKTGGHTDQLSRRHPAMDRFRITALFKLLENTSLEESDRMAAMAMLDSKIRVYGDGALKRGREAEHAALYERRRALDNAPVPPC